MHSFHCGYSLVVKFQSSKLARRVRFPLPAPFSFVEKNLDKKIERNPRIAGLRCAPMNLIFKQLRLFLATQGVIR